jgi:eukaryotic-like serine/threonine-protein kinase
MTSGPVVIARRGRDPRSETEHEADMEGPQTTATARLVLGRYRIGRRLGAGGFGVVWQAWDEKLERDVAVKVVPREAGGDPARVEREARAAARLNHPAIVALYELAGDEHELFLVSELVTGSTLAELAKAGAVADRDVARLGATLCDALAHAHERGVIHRDVKPQNVMVLAEPAAGAGFAKLTDFGVAHVSAAADPLTHTGDVVGTLAYMAPEQAEGERVTPACDVYSLALTLYEAWTGSNPVRAAGPAATARRVGQPLPSLALARRDLPLELCDAIDDALEPDPELRPAPADLRRALREAEPELSDEGGLVEPATQRRFGLGAVERRGWNVLGRRRTVDPEAARPRLPALAARLGAGAATGLLVLGALAGLGPEPPFSAAAAAGIAALACALLPRAGWLLTALGLFGWLASPGAGREGTALLLAAACLPVPFLLPRAGTLWSLPALAPLLGAIGLGPAFVGVAALAPTAPRRAGLAATGFLWLALAEVATGHNLLFGVADGTLARVDWQDSLGGAAVDAIGPLITSPALAPAIVWAAFAVGLPLLVRGRFLMLDALAAGGWAAGLAAAHAALGGMLATATVLDQPRGGVAGALVAALVVVAAAQLAPSDPSHIRPQTAPA